MLLTSQSWEVMAEETIIRMSGTPEVTLASDATSKGRWPCSRRLGATTCFLVS